MNSNYNPVDLINTSWTVDDFRNHSFQTNPNERSDKIKVIYRQIGVGSRFYPLISRVLDLGKRVIKEMTGNQNASDLASITEAFDKIVRAEIYKETGEIEQLLKTGMLQEKEIKRRIEGMNRLTSNLKAHNEYIKGYNKTHLFQSPLHEEPFGFIQMWCDALKGDLLRKAQWFDRNAQYQQFKFNQSAWGGDYILNTGACAAMNYRWIKELLKDPTKIITSQRDFDPDAVKVKRDPTLPSLLENIRKTKIDKSLTVESARTDLRKREALTADEMEEFDETPSSPLLSRQDSSIGVKPEDRRIQAQMKVDENRKFSISQQVLAKDHMQKEELIGWDAHISTITPLIETLMKKREEEVLLLEKSAGAFEIFIARTKKNEQGETTWNDGHVMGMQIDPTREIYRFWDVNSGFYSYPDLNTLKKEAETYMHDFYGKDEEGVEYNDFRVWQYSPKS